MAVLQGLARAPRPDVEVTLVTPGRRQVYSGMLPGCIAGHYSRQQCEIDLGRLAERANVRIRLDTIVAMDANRRCVALSCGDHLDYDVLSLDVGSEIDLSWLDVLGERVIPVRPGTDLLDRWPTLIDSARRRTDYRLVVVGGGAAGVEVALAVQYAFHRACIDGSVVLAAAAEGLLPGVAQAVRERVEHEVRAAGVRVCRGYAAGTVDGVLLADGEFLRADTVIAATGGVAPCWLQVRGPTLSSSGYVLVDAGQRSVSHPELFAAGDVCTRVDIQVERSGVHAVHAGPVLAANVLDALAGRAPRRRYRPRQRSLYLLACGPRRAVAWWGRWSAAGALMWRWKDRIDRRFVARQALPDTVPAPAETRA